MLFKLGFVGFTTYVLVIGFLMFAMPLRYIKVVSWYYTLTRQQERISSTGKFSGWAYRVSGLGLFIFGLVLAWQSARFLLRH